MSASDWVGLFESKLPVDEALTFASDPAAGGIAVFFGTTRVETNADGKALVALDYEAYADMAHKQLVALAADARQRWPLLRVVLLHRTGRVAVGEPSVVVIASTPHRAEAFDACRWLIDSLKSIATIWKQEVWSDGGKSWVHPE